MKAFMPAVFLALSAFPATAFERMQRSACQESFTRLADLVPDQSAEQDATADEIARSIGVTPDGWCQFEARSTDIDLDFDVFEWRMEDTERWTRDGIPPLALDVRVSGLDPDAFEGDQDTDRPLVDMTATLRQEPDAGLVILERVAMENSAGDALAISGVFERVFLSSPSMMQVSLGSATFKAGLMVLTLDGTHENPFGFEGEFYINGTEQDRSEGAFDVLSAIPDGVIDDASRAELMAFAADLPKPVGKLETSVSSERGLGLMQVAMSMVSAVESAMAENDGRGNMMEILLDGLTITADWTPDAQNAD